MSNLLLNRRAALGAGLGWALLPLAGRAAPSPQPAVALEFRGTRFLHRWSRNEQHEFTPATDADLKTWRDMITLNVHAATRSGEQLADVANRVLGNYQQHGKVLQTRSVPRTPQKAAEHLIVAVLGTQDLLEATFARCMLHEGRGLVAVVSHRVYGQRIGNEMSRWLADHGAATEQALMAYGALPGLQALGRLPASA